MHVYQCLNICLDITKAKMHPPDLGFPTPSLDTRLKQRHWKSDVKVFLKTDILGNFDDLITKINEVMNRQEYKMYRTQLGVNCVHLTKECPPSSLAIVVVKKILKLPFFVVSKLFLPLLTATFCHQTKSLWCRKFPI